MTADRRHRLPTRRPRRRMPRGAAGLIAPKQSHGCSSCGIVDRRRLPHPGDLRSADRALRLRPGRRTPPGASPSRAAPIGRTSSAPRSSRPTCCRGSIWGARTAIEVVLARGRLLARDRRAARADLRLRRRLARPRPGADHGRAVRVPLPAARDRDRVPALRHDRPGHLRRGDRDHGRLHTAVLPRRPQPRDQRPRGAPTWRRRARSEPRAGRSSAATCSST